MEINVAMLAKVVILALRNAQYAESTIRQYKKSIKAVKKLAETQGGLYTKDLGSKFAAMTTNSKTGKFSKQLKYERGRLVRLFDSFVDTGVVDLSIYRPKNPRETLKSIEFERILVSWHTDMKKRGLAKSTMDYYGCLANEYLLFLERSDTHTLNDAKASTVPGFLFSLVDGAWAKTSMYSLISNFRPFLKFLGKKDLVYAVNMIRAKRHRNIFPRVDKTDERKVIDACCSGAVPARDAAITLLALLTGIRACDIIALRIGDIDWISGRISIIQQKTKNPLTLPLSAPVGNAISRYLLEERPTADDNHLFLRSFAPYTAFKDHAAIYSIISRVFDAAGADMKNCGTRLLRHNAATRMIESDTPLPTVAAVLGHADPDSADAYISTDEKRMRMCVLPLPKGVLS